LLSNSTFQSMLPQLVTVAMILVVVPVTNFLGDTSLDQARRVSIEGPETLDNKNLVKSLKGQKNIADFVCNFDILKGGGGGGAPSPPSPPVR